MTKLHVVDNFVYNKEVIEYTSETEIKLIKIKDVKYFEEDDERTRGGQILIEVILDNDVKLEFKDDDFECYRDNKGTVYAPVYDVETCEIEGYSMYEAEDVIGFVNRGYKYTDSLAT